MCLSVYELCVCVSEGDGLGATFLVIVAMVLQFHLSMISFDIYVKNLSHILRLVKRGFPRPFTAGKLLKMRT